eukprot:13721962-Alexandrium_andersonii.AAC.2
MDGTQPRLALLKPRPVRCRLLAAIALLLASSIFWGRGGGQLPEKHPFPAMGEAFLDVAARMVCTAGCHGCATATLRASFGMHDHPHWAWLAGVRNWRAVAMLVVGVDHAFSAAQSLESRRSQLRSRDVCTLYGLPG